MPDQDSLLVVGGNSGIGREVAGLAQLQGWNVDAVGQEECDVLKPDAVDNFIISNGPWGHVVYTAGMAHLAWIADYDDEGLIDTFDLNVFGFVRVLSSLVRTQETGRVVAVVSDASENPMRGSLAYCSSKAALAMAVRCAARELAPFWQVNGVSPCVVEDTPMTNWIDEQVPVFRGWEPEVARSYEQQMIPMKRRCRKDEVAEVVMNTLRAPSFMTGSIINITGGK